MSRNGKNELDLRTASAQEVADVMNRGVIDALREHKRAGNSIVVWDRELDQVLTLRPDQIVVPDESPGDVELSVDRHGDEA